MIDKEPDYEVKVSSELVKKIEINANKLIQQEDLCAIAFIDEVFKYLKTSGEKARVLQYINQKYGG